MGFWKREWQDTDTALGYFGHREQGKFLRVILLPDGETVHNAFFDRSFKGEGK
jgi:hypothetical protein